MAAQLNSRRLRILLAEDNLTNRLVAIKLVDTLGVGVDIANNGVDAVAACSATAYDLVFMDVMMPEMDGLAATRAIRQLAPPYCNPHIIALTANVQPSDKAKCFEAGMNDFLPKPVTRSALARALARFLPPEPAEPPADTDVEHPPPVIFNEVPLLALQRVIGIESAQSVVNIFVEDTKKRIAVMRRELAAGCNEKVATEAHATKSSAAMLGFQRLSRLAETLEADAPALERNELEARINDLSSAYLEVSDLVLNRTNNATLAEAG
jgi:CheY-like chemotaxis protein/HPt (histidine-containing phosphotransfer) domain-containing protein